MGLYRLITEKYRPAQTLPLRGLLARSEELRGELQPERESSVPAQPSDESEDSVEKPFAVFHSFAEDLGIERMGVVIPSENGYCMVFSHGLDRDTIWRFCSETEYWHDFIDACSEWQDFSGEELEEFYPFFSEPEQKGLKKLHIKSFTFSKNRTGFFILIESELNSAKQGIDAGAVDILLPSVIELAEEAGKVLPDIPPYSLINRREPIVEGEIAGALSRNGEVLMIQISLAPVLELLADELTTVDREILFAGAFNLIQNIPGFTIIPYAYKSYIMRVLLTGDLDLFELEVKNTLVFLFGKARAEALQIQQAGRSSDQEELTGYLIRNT